PRTEHQQVPSRRTDAATVPVALEQLDERAMELLGALRVEPLDECDHRRRRGREELPERLARLGLEPERPVVEVKGEVVAEHRLDVILPSPLVHLAPLDRLVREPAVELAEPRVRLPRRE